MLRLLCRELGIEIDKPWEGYDGETYYLSPDAKLWKCIKQYQTVEVDIRKILTGEIKPKFQPKTGEYYYVPHLNGDRIWGIDIWGKDIYYDSYMWDRGLVFKTEKEVKKVANKMLEIPKGEI